MPYQLDPLSPNGISKKPDAGFTPYFAGGPGKPSLLDSVNGKHGAVQIVGGTNVTVDNTGTDIRISASGGGGGGSSAWGSITGDITDQADLQTAFNDFALQTDLDLKAPLNSPALTGTPTAPTPLNGSNDTKIATTEYVDTAIADISGVVLDAQTVGAGHAIYRDNTSGTLNFKAISSGGSVTLESSTDTIYFDVTDGYFAPTTYAVGRVDHGSDNSVARPSNYYSITWVGDVEPLNATAADEWIDTSG